MYSRRIGLEEKRNRRKAILFTGLTLISLVVLFFYGIPTIAKFASFLGELKNSSEVPDKEDLTPPAPPRLEPLPSAVKDKSLELRGDSEPGATIIIFLNGKESEVIVNSEGQFNFTLELVRGENFILAQAKDQTGNESSKGSTQTVILDNEAPSLEITKPQDGSSFFGSKQRQVVVAGKSGEKTQVFVNDRWVVVEADGSFSFATTLSEGQNTFNIKAQDEAGNLTEKALTVTFTP